MNPANSLSVQGLDHVTIVVSDLEATRRFYVDRLGMDEVSRPDFDFPGAWYQAGKTQIHATLSDPKSGRAGWGDREVGEVSRGHHFAFEVHDARSAAETARALGIEIAAGPKLRPDGCVQVYLFDPDRHLVELFSVPENR